MRGFAAAAILVLAAAQLPEPSYVPTDNCYYSGNGVTYDLSPLSLSGGYTIQDYRQNSDQVNWQYSFSVCQDFTPTQAACGGQTGPAFQIGAPNSPLAGQCYKLGDTAANGVIFPDPFNPSHGAVLSYSNGAACNLPGVSTTRNFTVLFRCSNSNGLLPGSQDYVNEEMTCNYFAYIYSRAGCPRQCGHLGQPLCSGHGVCDYDTSISSARCFCDTGFSGNSCEIQGTSGNPAPASYGGNIAGGFFGGLFAVAIVIAAFVAYRAKTQNVGFLDAYYGIFRSGHASTHAPLDSNDGFYTQGPSGGSAPVASSAYVPPAVGGTTSVAALLGDVA